jgi:hypothetical protein
MAVKKTVEFEIKGDSSSYEAAAKKSVAASKKVEEAAEKLGDTAGKAGSSASKLAGALGMISPEAATAAQALADLGDVGEVAAEVQAALGISTTALVAGMGVLAIGLAAAAYAYSEYQASIEAAEAAEKLAIETTEADLAIQRKVTDSVLKLANLRGEISDREYGRLAAASTAEEVFAARKLSLIEAVTAEAASLNEANDTIAAHKDRIEGAAEAAGDMGRQSVGMGAKVASSRAAISEATAAAAEHEMKLGTLSTRLGKLVEDENAYAATLVEIAEIEGRTAGETLSFDDQVAALREKLANEELDRQRMLREARDQDANEGLALLAKVEAEQIASAERVTEARIKEAERAAAEQQRLDALQIQSTANLFGSIADIAGTASEGLTDKQQDAQLALFTAQQIAAGAQAGVNAALGISQAAASAPPPYNIPPILAATAQGAAAVAAVAAVPAPAFNDTPMVLQNEGAGRQTVSLGSGDYYAAARTREDLEKQVLGPRAAAPASAPYTLAPSGRVFGETVQAAARLNTPLRRELRAVSSNTPGFRS